MAFSIKNPETDLLARELAKVTGESLTDAVTTALRDRLARLNARKGPKRLSAELMEIGHRCAGLPLLDDRSPDEILGYDDEGVSR